jgi:hypothetical protein
MGNFKGVRNANGRPKGAVNLITAEIREHFQNLVSDNLEQLDSDLKSLEPLQRIKIVIELSKFVLPTLKATELTTDSNNSFQPITITFVDSKDDNDK